MGGIAWVNLEGVVNMRDVGGLPAAGGRRVQPGRLLRSDNLQSLSEEDIAELDRIGVTDIVDLRTGAEVAREGPGPLREVDRVAHHHHTLFREQRAVSTDDVLALPWDDPAQEREPNQQPRDAFWTSHYLGYLQQRPDSVLAALRVIAGAQGATIVHCAAGKDRTGTIVGLALAVAEVPPEAIAADYAATAERIEQIIARLMTSETYRANLENRTVLEQTPQAASMTAVLSEIDEVHGGVLPWLTGNGWTDADTVALRAKLLDP